MTNKHSFKVLGLLLVFLISACASKLQKQSFASWKRNLSTGEQFVKEGENNEAIPYLEKALVSLEKSYKPSNQDLARTNRILGFANEKDREYKKAIAYYLKALSSIQQEGEENDTLSTKIFYRLGLNYRRIGDYDNSINFLKKRLSLIDTTEQGEREQYANILNSISISYKYKDDYTNALEYNKLSAEIKKDIYGENDPKYLRYISSLNQIYWNLGKYGIAIPLQRDALSLYPEEEKDGINYAIAIQTMSLLYNGTNEYHKEIKLLKEAKKILSKIPKYKDRIIDINNNLAVAFDNLGDYEKAITFIKDVLDNTSKDDKFYPVRLQNLAFYYTKLGEFDKALSIYNEALIACEKIFGTEHSKYAQLIDAMGQLHLRRGEFSKSKELFEEAIGVVENIESFDASHSEYGFYLNNYARVLLQLNQHEEAIKLLIKNIKISESDSIIDKERYYRKKHDLAKAYIQTAKYQEALDLLNDFKDDYGLKLGSTHADYGQLSKSIGKAYIGISEYDNAMPYVNAANNVLVSEIDKVFKFRSEKENKEFIKTIVPEFDEFQSMLMLNKMHDSELTNMNLNNQLLLKNLLLSQSKRILDKLVESKDTSVVNSVYKYKELKSIVSKNYSLKPKDRLENFDSLKNVLNEKEVELAKLYNSKFGDDTTLVKDWRKSEAQLKTNEIAIEFASFKNSINTSNVDSTLYVAYVYKNEWDNPKLIKLFEEKELIKILRNKTPKQLYATRGSKAKSSVNLENIYDLIWKPLEKELTDVATVYFSPSGILNQIPFSAISINKDQRLIDKYNIVRLSSTSNISNLEVLNQPNDIVFFGGIDYDYSPNNKVTDSSILNLKEFEAFKASNSNIGNTKSWKYLPGTLTEIKNIQFQLDKNKISNKVFNGIKATEEEFKRFDGNSPKIIHISTHGFFYENVKDESINNKMLDNVNIYSYAEDPLLRSGLILAGGNYAWKHGVNAYEEEDGVLTAMEISNMDLSNTDLVVLSACETGLGDIEGSEGVYGLQRAFKMAGVNILIMSLWDVPDKETAEFMEDFYNNWLSGMELREAFNQTQRALSKRYHNEPEKWAAFVLFE